MNTRKKNKSTHPGAPDMTPSQLARAGLSHAPGASTKRQTKDQQIAALKEDLQAARDLITSIVSRFSAVHLCFYLVTLILGHRQNRSRSNTDRNDDMQESPDTGGDTEPATDTEEADAHVGTKRKAAQSAGPASRYVMHLLVPRLHANGK